MTLVATCLVIPQHMHLSGTVTKIWRLKDNGATTLTFWGHVTSWVTWPFDSWESTFYGWSIVTMHLSSTVMEIWPFEVLPGSNKQCTSHKQWFTSAATSVNYLQDILNCDQSNVLLACIIFSCILL